LVAKVLPPEDLGALLSQYGDIGTRPCPDGQIWIGTLNFDDSTLSLNSCIDIDLATSYAQSYGLF
jgi:hypothetical protein